MRVRIIRLGWLVGLLLLAGCTSGGDATTTTTASSVATTTTTEPPLDLQAHAESLLVGIQSEGDFLSLSDPAAPVPGEGTGLVISEEGLILTTASSVVGADRINVSIPGEEFPLVGELDAAAECANLALVRVDHQFSVAADLGAAEAAVVGSTAGSEVATQPAAATPAGDSLLLAPGESAPFGAVLFDSEGIAAGIVTGVDSDPQRAAMRGDVADLWVSKMRSREVVSQLGFTLLEDAEGQVFVAGLATTGPGVGVDLRVGDVITKVADKDLAAGIDQLCEAIVQDAATLEVIRDGRRYTGEFPAGTLDVASRRSTEQIQEAVVEIRTAYDSRGTGFFVSDNGLVVTNYHVAGGYDELFLRFDGKPDKIPARVIGGSGCADIAVLQATQPGPYQYLEWAPQPPALEDDIRVVGFPNRTDTISFQDGTVSKEVSDDIEWFGFLTNFESSAKTDGGNSGSPVLNDIGEIVGVHYASEQGGRTVIRNARHLMGVEAREIVDQVVSETLVVPGFQVNPKYGDDLDDSYKTVDGVTGYIVEIDSIQPGGPGDLLGLELRDEIIVLGDVLPQTDVSGFRQICNAVESNIEQAPMDVVIWRSTADSLYDGELFGTPLTRRPEPYRLASADGSISAQVPGRWVDHEDIEDDELDWIGYWTAEKLRGPGSYFGAFGHGPGMRLMWSADKATTHTTASHLEGLSYASSATDPITAFADHGFSGHYQRYDFAGGSAIEYAFTVDGDAESPMIMLFVADAGHRIDATVDRILETMQLSVPVVGEG